MKDFFFKFFYRIQLCHTQSNTCETSKKTHVEYDQFGKYNAYSREKHENQIGYGAGNYFL